MATTTIKAIRDRIVAVVEATAPTVHPELPFDAYLDEGGADFRRWARSHPAVCTRRVQVRTVSLGETPDVSNTDVEARLVTFEIVVAYAKRWRAGASLDRDDTMERDQMQIEHAVGMFGRANFTPPTFPDACWVSGEVEQELDDDKVDFLVITQTMQFYRAFP